MQSREFATHLPRLQVISRDSLYRFKEDRLRRSSGIEATHPLAGQGPPPCLAFGTPVGTPGLTPCAPSVPDYASVLKASRATSQFDYLVLASDQGECR